MVDLRVLKKRGITTESLKTIFTSEKPSAQIETLTRRIQARIQDGRSRNFSEYKVYAAIDEIWDSPFRQVPEALTRALEGQKVDPKALMNAAQDWGLTHLIEDERDPKTRKPTGRKAINVPSFFKVTVPLVRAYLTIRLAKLVTDRNLDPMFKFEPIRSTPMERIRCELITQRVNLMCQQFNYMDDLRQRILHMLLYTNAVAFIQEEWFEEKQTHLTEAGEEVERIVREGLRYHLPHPTRTFWDRSQPLSTLNSDSGCEYCGYWRVRRYGDIKRNMKLWNTDRIAISPDDVLSANKAYFSTVYPCVMAWPTSTESGKSLDRENQSQWFYNSSFEDTAVLLTEYFEKLNPKENGLGDYDHDVWFRFVVAGDTTVMYCAPLPGAPGIAYTGDVDESRSLNPSLAMEILPYQDQVSNLLTQQLLAVKQNLANLTFVDTDIVNEEDIQRITNEGERHFRGLNMVRFSGKNMSRQLTSVKDAFGSVRFPQLDTVSIGTAITVVLNILERVLVMSAQEVAAAASHEQTAEELRNIAQSTSTRLALTAMPVDRGNDAWKRQLYTYLMAYGEEEVYASLPGDSELTQETLNRLGLTVEEHPATKQGRTLVKGKKSKLQPVATQIELFASTRDGNDRVNNSAMATVMTQFLAQVLQNPGLAQALGPDQAIELLNKCLEFMGVPRDFKLVNKLPEGAGAGVTAEQIKEFVDQQIAQVLQQVQQLTQQSQAAMQETLQQALMPVMELAKSAAETGDRNTLALQKMNEFLQIQDAQLNAHSLYGPGGEPPPEMVTPTGVPVA
ncbi:MAG TPA: hypothetical protein VEH27_11905 [Methylomirabilota bacterium]|nr:hypothetical protein [Methylomirabilota bacterium]